MRVWKNRKAWIDFLHDGTLAASSEILWVPNTGSPVQLGTFDGTNPGLESVNYSGWVDSGVVRVKAVAGTISPHTPGMGLQASK